MEAKLKVGPSGSYFIDVNGKTVLKKESQDFPTDQDVLAAVARAIEENWSPPGTA